jgi:hypothetical protein
MITMIEKMARAMVAAEQEQWDLPAAEWDRETLERHGLINLARAALEAIREPNDGSVEVVEIGVGWDYTQNGIRGVFARMIDAILNEETT